MVSMLDAKTLIGHDVCAGQKVVRVFKIFCILFITQRREFQMKDVVWLRTKCFSSSFMTLKMIMARIAHLLLLFF